MAFSYDPKKLKLQAKQRAGTAEAGSGLGGGDWIGYGMQIGGALLDQRAEEKRRKEDREREDALLRLSMQEKAKQRGFDERARIDDLNLARQDRGMRGLEFLSGQMDRADKLTRSRSFRDALLGV